MGRPLRFVEPDSVVEITTRAMQGRLLLTPSEATNNAVLGVLGRALFLYAEIKLHSFVVASNHMHLLLTTPNAGAMSDFMRFVNGNIAREVGIIIDWREKFWGRRYRSIPVVDEGAQVGRMGYVIAHGCKECLVDHPEAWPGASSLKALLSGSKLYGTWIDRTELGRARKRRREGKPVPEAKDFATAYEITLTPLPCWKALDSKAMRRTIQAIVDQVTRDAAAANERERRVPLGGAVIRHQPPDKRPARIKKSPAPKVHATTLEARLAHIEAYRAFEGAYRTAVERLERGERDVEFPPYSFIPVRLASPSLVPRRATPPSN
jgi:REP element-mobilizing transposase RayT